MTVLNKNKIGLIVGIFSALVHTVWVIFVGIMPQLMQKFVNWVSMMHLIKPTRVLETFSITHAVMLIIFSFVGGYIVGWIFSVIWNGINKE